ncbi:MAG: chemotaxis protein CheW [Pseudomonadota bacterium]
MNAPATSEALNVLAGIKASTLIHASPLPHKEEGQQEWQGLGFSIGGARLVAKIGEVSEMLIAPRLTRLPGVKPWILGVANVRGRLLPVIDLHQFLGLPSTVAAHKARVMVVEQDDMVAGLVIEQSLGIQHFPQDAFEVGLGQDLEGLGRFVSGAFRSGGRLYHHIELTAVLRDEAFFDVAATGDGAGSTPNYWHLPRNEFQGLGGEFDDFK